MSNDREFRVKIKTEADTAGLKLFTHETGEVHKAIRELAGQFPIAAEALRLLTNPIGGSISGGIIGFSQTNQLPLVESKLGRRFLILGL